MHLILENKILKFDTTSEAQKFAIDLHDATGDRIGFIATPEEPFEIFWTRERHSDRVQHFLGGLDLAFNAQYQWHFARPYVCAIHEPTNRGYYLDRSYVWICNVDNILRPGVDEGPRTLVRVLSHETEFNHQAASFTTPEWACKLPVSEFTTYWMY
jgi:hypothetical protein